MQGNQNIQLIKLELNMEQDIVMHNVLMILNLFKDKLIVKTGEMIKENMEVAVLNLMFGKQINKQMLSLLILALNQEIINAKELNVVMDQIDKMVYVIRMDLI